MSLELSPITAMPVAASVYFVVAVVLCWGAAFLALRGAQLLGTGDRQADRLRLLSNGATIGFGLWAAALCTAAALATLGAGLAVSVSTPLLLALPLAAAAAAATMWSAVSRSRLQWWLAVVAGTSLHVLAVLFVALALHRQVPTAAMATAIAGALITGHAALAHALRAVRSGAGRAGVSWCAKRALVVAGSGGGVLLTGMLVMGAGLDRAVPAGVASSVAILAALAAGAMALTMAALLLDGRHSGVQRELRKRLREAQARGAGVPLVDSLTDLPNRAGLEDALRRAAGDAERGDGRVALVIVGVDSFKHVNDAFGHGGGDTVLRELGRRLAQGLDALSSRPAVLAGPLARIGGDEFALLVRGRPGRDELARLCTQLLELLGQRVAWEGGEVTVGASIGVACSPDDGAAGTLLPHAEAALRAAKEAGGATYAFFEARLIDEARDRLELLRDLRRAVDEKQLELFYQPKIDASNGQVTAAEALLRWHHPTRGMVSPAMFIPLAERYGLISALGNWVIEDACRQAHVWRKAGLKMRVAINLSAYQMRQDDLVERIQRALKKHGVVPSRLTCEITETVAMEDTQVTQRTFERLGEAGIHLSIDDFGTGYSSLAYLRRLPASELKIDRAFVKDLETSADARAIVDAVVKMAHAIGLKVVAEGVETMGQRDALIELGCDELQGYMFAKPMSARSLLLWAMDDRPAQHAFRASLFAASNTMTRQPAISSSGARA
jgi:diguanylate cyclase (GGDEF)-like protein